MQRHPSPQLPKYNFHEKFSQHERSANDRFNKDAHLLNNIGVNDSLRTRPTNKPNVTMDNGYVPSIQKYNRRGKLY